MKALALVLTSALVIFGTACSKDNGSSPSGPTPNPEKVDRKVYPNVANQIFGGWTAQKPDVENGTTFIMRLYFNQAGRVSISMECKNAQSDIFTVAETDATITANSIEILNATENTETVGNFQCTVSVKQMMINYNITGNVLDLQGGLFNRQAY